MFIRNGEVLGSVLHSAVPGTQPQQPEPELTPEPAETVETGDKPPHYAAKGEWVDYAVSRGADREESESLTKNELVELYG